jgi:hypothetical protein
MIFRWLLLLPLIASAQTAVVVPLKPADAQQAKADYDALQAAQAKWDATQKKILEQYASTFEDVPDYGDGNLLTSGTAFLSSTITWPDSTCIMENSPLYVRADGVVAPKYDEACLKKLKAQKEKDKADAEKARLAHEKYVQSLPRKRIYRTKPEWQGGIVFSPDFLFIVPRPVTTTAPESKWGYYNLQGVTTPASITGEVK